MASVLSNFSTEEIIAEAARRKKKIQKKLGKWGMRMKIRICLRCNKKGTTRWWRGHKCPQKNTVRGSLTDTQRLAIVQEYKDGGVSQSDLAVKYGISQNYVSLLIHTKRKK